MDSCQLYYPILTAKQWPRNSSSLRSKPQKLAACSYTSLPLTEEEPEKSASLCFQSLAKASTALAPSVQKEFALTPNS